MTKFDPYIKGEPPSSEKFNTFTKDVAADLNIIAKQTDYLSAKIVELFNMFNNEVKQEDNFLSRIKSKTKILQLYSNSSADDIFYLGNSFDNLDYINVSKIPANQLPLIQNGQMQLQTNKSEYWIASNIYIDEQNSNGFIGNNHAAQIGTNETNITPDQYQYFFTKGAAINIGNLIDNNPLTYFEYEQIDVPIAEINSRAAYEFKYIKPDAQQQATKINWASFTQEPLKLTLVMENNIPSKANFIKIAPLLADNVSLAREVKVTKIEVTSSAGTENILFEPITISSTQIPSSLEAARNFYYKEATVKFSERIVNSIKVFFEQAYSNDILLKHLYWTPGNEANSPYAQQATTRFRPYGAVDITKINPRAQESSPPNRTIQDESLFIPFYNQPNFFKSPSRNSTQVTMTFEITKPEYFGWVIKVPSSTAGQAQRYIKPNINYRIDNGDLTIVLGSATYTTTNVKNASFFQNKTIAEQLLQAMKDSEIDFAEEWGIDVSNGAVVEEVGSTVNATITKRINLYRNYEVLNAKRRSIGIRDISVGYEEFADKCVMVSKSHDFPFDVKYITLSSDAAFSGSISNNTGLNNYIKYYISVDNGTKWIQISSIENSFSGIPEIISFNENISDQFKINGVSYLNAPEVPETIKGVIVKVELTKPTGDNITPIVYSYKLGARTNRLWQLQIYKKESS